MQTEQSTERPEITSSSKKIGEFERKGLRVVTWMNGADFSAEVHDGDAVLWGTGLDPNRGRAERLCEEWVDGEVERRETIDEAFYGRAVAGWRLR